MKNETHNARIAALAAQLNYYERLRRVAMLHAKENRIFISMLDHGMALLADEIDDATRRQRRLQNVSAAKEK